jgi:hypothetical protein
VNLPLGNLEAARAVLKRLQAEPEPRLKRRVRLNDAALRRRFHWQRFGREVQKAIEARSRKAELTPEPLAMAWQRLTCPMRPWRLRWLAQALYQF